jgi:hypothetical protein
MFCLFICLCVFYLCALLNGVLIEIFVSMLLIPVCVLDPLSTTMGKVIFLTKVQFPYTIHISQMFILIMSVVTIFYC